MMTFIPLLGRCPAKCYPRGALATLVLIGVLAQATPGQAASKAKDSRELRAREDFATGHYQEAIDLYGKLYAEKLHPTYLRNIGRCYQKTERTREGDRFLPRLPDSGPRIFRQTSARRSKATSPTWRP